MKSLKLLLATGMFLSLTGCLEISFKGSLKVDQILTVKNSKNKMINLNPGSYTAEVNVSSKSVEVVVPVSRRDKQTFKLNIPKGMDLPENGEFELNPAMSGQPFHLKAKTVTTINDTAPRRDVESCTWERWETVCTPNGTGQVTCSQRPVTVYGRKVVTYFERMYRRELQAELFDAADLTKKLATSQGLNQSSQRIYLDQGFCY